MCRIVVIFAKNFNNHPPPILHNNLQGLRVAVPAPGVYIRVAPDGTAIKVKL